MLGSRRTFLAGLATLPLAGPATAAVVEDRSLFRQSVKIITPIPNGAGPDALLRFVAERLGSLWGQQPTVVNQPGAAGLIAARSAYEARPDGQTLFMALASNYVSLPILQPKLPFDMGDFVPVGLIGDVPMLIAAAPGLPVTSLADLLALSKSRPGGITVASAATPGEMPQLTLELLKLRSRGELEPVLYTSPAAAVTDVISGRVDAILDGLAGPAGRSQGQLKHLAVASRERLPSRPDLPTVAETLPGFAASGWWVLVAPPKTPEEITRRIGEDLAAVLSAADLQQKFQAFGAVTRPLRGGDLARFIGDEQALWKPIAQTSLTHPATATDGSKRQD